MLSVAVTVTSKSMMWSMVVSLRGESGAVTSCFTVIGKCLNNP